MYERIFWVLCAIASSSGQSINSPPLDWIQTDESGAYRYGYATGDQGRHYHLQSATADNTVSGKFGYKDPKTGGDLQTTYTAGRRGFRARGPHIARRMDLSQIKPPFSRPDDDGKYHPELDNYFDPNEDRGYDFSYRTSNHIKEEHANRVGDVQGRYSYIDDIGFRHNVNYIAGAKTGFVVTNPVPDTFAQARGGPLYFVGKTGGSKIRGFSAVQKNLNGAYRFSASGPDHKRSEISDASGNRRGVYTYLDDKGVQHTVEYIAGPKIGYKVINNKRGFNYNPTFPYFVDSSTIQPLFPSSTGGSFAPPFPTVPVFPASPSEDPFPSFPTDGGNSGGTAGTSSNSGFGKFPSPSPPSSNAFPSKPSDGSDGFSSPSSGGGGSGSISGGGSGGNFPSGSGENFPSRPSSDTSGGYSPQTSGSGSSSGGFPSPTTGSDSGFSSQPSGSGSGFPSQSPSGGNFFPSQLSGGSSSFADYPSSGGGAQSGSGSSFSGEDGVGSKKPTVSPKPPNSLFEPVSGKSPFPLDSPGNFGQSDGFISPTFPSSASHSTQNKGDDSSPKWNYDFDYFLKDPANINKDWSKPLKGQGPGQPSTPKIPILDPFPDFFPSPFPTFLLPDPFDEGLNTAESSAGLKPSFNEKNSSGCDNCDMSSDNIRPDKNSVPSSNSKNHKDDSKHFYKGYKGVSYPSRGSVRFGGVKKDWHKIKNEEGYFAIPPGVAVRAHVQSLDIVPFSKRYVSPGEALEHRSSEKEKGDKQ